MKRSIGLFLALAMLFALCGCAQLPAGPLLVNVTDNRSPKEEPLTEDQFALQAEVLPASFGNAGCYILVKNNSDAVVTVQGTASSLNAKGEENDTAELRIVGLGPGESSVGFFVFSLIPYEEMVNVNYQLTYTRDREHEPVLGALEASAWLNDGSILLSVENTGTVSAQDLKAVTLLRDEDGQALWITATGLTGPEKDLLPGMKLSTDIAVPDEYGSFADISIWFMGCSDAAAPLPLPDDALDVQFLQILETEEGYRYCLSVKNLSDSTVRVIGNAEKLDINDMPVASAFLEQKGLKPGETAVVYFLFAEMNHESEVVHRLYAIPET